MLEREADLAERGRFAFDPDEPVDPDMALPAEKSTPGPVRVVLGNREHTGKRYQDFARTRLLEAKHEHVVRLPSDHNRSLAPHALQDAGAGEMRQGFLRGPEADGEKRCKLRLRRKPV